MKKRIFTLSLALLCLFTLSTAAYALEVDSDRVYCFTGEDFSNAEDPLVGICITSLPQSRAGTVFLGSRVVQPGDILTAEQVNMLTFSPVRTEFDGTAEVSYLPIYNGRVAPSATMTIAIRGKEDKAPVAEDFSLETYKNLPGEGALKVHDPEGQALTYTLHRQPRRGTVALRDDGSFTYTPKKNKVGVDSFTYTATDPAGKVSREATVTIQILRPTDDARYTDTAQFEAEWLRNTGLFQGEKVGDALCFHPEKTVSRGEFLAVLMNLLDAPLSDAAGAEVLNESAPQWLQPYLTAAMRSGFLEGFPTEDLNAPIGRNEAAVILQNVLDLPVEATLCEECGQKAPLCKGQIPPSAGEMSAKRTKGARAQQGCHADSVTGGLLPADEALAVMNQNGLLLDVGETLTRAEMAELLYEVSRLAPTAPGLMVFGEM